MEVNESIINKWNYLKNLTINVQNIKSRHQGNICTGYDGIHMLFI